MHFSSLVILIVGVASATSGYAVPIDKVLLSKARGRTAAFDSDRAPDTDSETSIDAAEEAETGTALSHEEDVEALQRQAKLEAEDEELERIEEEREGKAEHEKRVADKAFIAQMKIDEAQQKDQIRTDAMKETKMIENDAKAELELQKKIDEQEAESGADMFAEEQQKASAITHAEATLSGVHSQNGVLKSEADENPQAHSLPEGIRAGGKPFDIESSKELNTECDKQPLSSSKCEGIEGKLEKLREDEEALEKEEETAEKEMGGEEAEESEAEHSEEEEESFVQMLRQRTNQKRGFKHDWQEKRKGTRLSAKPHGNFAQSFMV
ncbi:conserved hypothetical protein [Neospora caninum Liverpool]|uniref:Uncharacterized protein n=1 Tax=Neospora caninum (strain Liverpool) TaxID=572307 RepID=F0V9X7_NEOCL|nr:conserved hypothetical protein [Neospora caninum Liverpool]CBZ50739.1 conserved hypothetical protein [Neospora caninum Liverpool]|eukprot:XP_003880772.1 conserved hypothetical protein [Neospora caninum Liverpool]